MSMFSNPIIMCGSIAMAIVLILILVVVICCKKSADKEREELRELSQEIEADLNVETVSNSEDKLETVLSKMQEALDVKETSSVSFEEEQEENAIISYQELLNSLGAKSSINIDSIELYDDELENQVEISDFNKEIIDSYQNENLDREFYNFQNDYCSEELPTAVVSETPSMNFDFSADNYEYVDEKNVEEYEIENLEPTHVYEARGNVVEPTKKFKRTEVISPIYGIIEENKKTFDNGFEEVEKLDFDDDSLIDKF